MGSKGTPFDSPGHGRHDLRRTFCSPTTSFREKPDFFTLHLPAFKFSLLVHSALLCWPFDSYLLHLRRSRNSPKLSKSSIGPPKSLLTSSLSLLFLPQMCLCFPLPQIIVGHKRTDVTHNYLSNSQYPLTLGLPLPSQSPGYRNIVGHNRPSVTHNYF